jgi:hypothetical protein
MTGTSQIFGLIEAVTSLNATAAFAFTIAIIISFDLLLKSLEYSLKGTPYLKIIEQKVYKELMVLGCISFTLNIIAVYGAMSERESWVTAFNFAHISIFFSALWFVVQSVIIMLWTGKQMHKIYDRSSSSLIEHVITMAQQQMRRRSWAFYLKWLPLSSDRDVIELKVIQIFFSASVGTRSSKRMYAMLVLRSCACCRSA